MKTLRWFNRTRFISLARIASGSALFAVGLAIAFIAVRPSSAETRSEKIYNINTLAGKIASLRGTAGLQIRFSAFIEQEAEEASGNSRTLGPLGAITPIHVLTSPLDGTTVTPPAITVNLDTAAASQNETAIAVDPNNSSRIVGGANDYVTRTWPCTVDGTPCSALGDGYSGTYFSNDGGSTWCCNSNPNANYVPTTDPSQIGTLIPGVERLVGGQYDAGGDPSVAFDSQGNVYYAGLGFDRTSPPSTVAVNKGTFDGGGNLSWGPPTFINQSTSPSTLNDKPWIAVDNHSGSPFQDRIYVTWTRFIFNAHNGNYVQSPIWFVYSTDGGTTFSAPTNISANAHYSQGSHPVVGPDGTLYVFWDGSTRLASTNSTYMVKSTDGGVTWSFPLQVSTLTEISGVHNTAFRVNSYPAAAVAPNGDVYVTWATEVAGSSVAVYSKSTDAGATWSAAAPVFAPGSRTADGYPVTQPTPDPDPNGCQAVNGCDGSTFNAPSPTGPIEDVFPAASASANGNVYLGAYRGDVVSPWQVCFAGPPPPEGRINCTFLGPYINNTRLDYWVTDVTTTTTNTVSTHPINTRYHFGGGFFGDYTDIATGSDNVFHAFWTDSNNVQNVVWWYGLEFVPTPVHQQDVVTGSGNF
jgi:BNR repeat-like domain